MQKQMRVSVRTCVHLRLSERFTVHCDWFVGVNDNCACSCHSALNVLTVLAGQSPELPKVVFVCLLWSYCTGDASGRL